VGSNIGTDYLLNYSRATRPCGCFCRTLQVVVGTAADRLAGEIRAALQRLAPVDTTSLRRRFEPDGYRTSTVRDMARRCNRAARRARGRCNVRGITLASSCLRIEIADAARLEHVALESLGLRVVALARPGCLQRIVGPSAPAAAAAPRPLLGP
jgi:hypothetical protein